MANTHDLFKHYNEAIKLSETDRLKLQGARDSLRSRMNNAFMKLNETDRLTHELVFQTQGSYIMDTIIKPESADFDLDDGVYFHGPLSEEQRKDTKAFHNIILKAIDKNIEIEEIQDKSTCVRVKYFSNFQDRDLAFHIDLPIYYAENYETPELAHKEEGWVESSPIEFVEWFERKAASGFEKSFLIESFKTNNEYEPLTKWFSDIRKNDTQLRKIVRYLKAWADLKKNEMPCGIIMTILAAKNFFPNDRDDIALKNTLVKIKEDLDQNNFTCYRPTPKRDEDLFAKTSPEEKEFFKKSLISFIESAEQAIEHPNQKDACSKWQKHLGNRFPCHLAKDEIDYAKRYENPPVKNDNAKSAI